MTIKSIDRNKIKELWKQGLSDIDIAKKLNTIPSAVCHIRNKELKLKRNFEPGWQPHSRKLSIKKRSLSIKKFNKKVYSEFKLKKLSYKELAEKYGVTEENIKVNIGKHLLELCRADTKCPYKALLPEYELL